MYIVYIHIYACRHPLWYEAVCYYILYYCDIETVGSASHIKGWRRYIRNMYADERIWHSVIVSVGAARISRLVYIGIDILRWTHNAFVEYICMYI